MMKKVSIYLIFVLIFLLDSCIKKTERILYDTGQVKEERVYEERNDTTKYYSTFYYLNGQIKSKGKIIGGLKDGEWHEWYADGSIYWNGNYFNGRRELKKPFTNPIITLEDSVLRKGIKTNLRIYIEGVHPHDMAIAVKYNDGITGKSDKIDLYDCSLLPLRSGVLKLIIFIHIPETTKFTVNLNVLE